MALLVENLWLIPDCGGLYIFTFVHKQKPCVKTHKNKTDQDYIQPCDDGVWHYHL